MRHLTVQTAAWAAWVAVAVVVAGVNLAETALRYAPVRRAAVRVYTLRARR